MDILHSNHKKIGIAFFLLAFIAGLTILIAGATQISDFADIKESIKEIEDILDGYGSMMDSYREQLNTLKEQYREAITPCIINIIFGIITMIIAAFGTYKVYKDGALTVNLSLVAVILAIGALGYAIRHGQIISEFKELNDQASGLMGGAQFEAPGESKASLALSIIAIIGAIISCFIPASYSKVRRGLAGLSGLLVFITSCIVLSMYESTEGVEAEVAAVVFIMLSSLVSMVYALAIEDGGTIKATPTPRPTATYQAPRPTTSTQPRVNSTPTPAPAPAPKVEETVDPVEKLKELKNLFDSGIINEEEYNAARQKYISKL